MKPPRSILFALVAAAALALPAGALAAGSEQLRDIAAGAADSNPKELVAMGGHVYFAADDVEHGIELWRSDGTEAGTQLVKDIFSDAEDGRPEWLVALGDTLYFAARASSFNIELWRSDGTAAGTELVEVADGGGEINPGAGARVVDLTAIGDHVYFNADDGVNGRELWRADADGAELVADIRSGASGSEPFDFTPLGSHVYFAADDGVGGRELWRSDGAPGGTTQQVADINAGGSSVPSQITAFGGHVYFGADDGVNGEELWRSDGSEVGTTMVEELMEGSGVLGSTLVRELTPFGSHLYLVARSVDEGVELWRTAADSSSIELVSTNLPGGDGVTPAELTVAGGDLYYSGASGASGADRELWRTSGAPAAQQRVADVFPGPDSSDPEGLVALGGTAYFGADDGAGRALWRADAGGATEVGPVAPTTSDELQLAPPVLAAGGSFYFAGDDGASGIEPWLHTPAPDPSNPVDGGGGGAADPTVPVAGGGGGAAEPPSLNVAPKLGLRLAGAKRQPVRGGRATLRLRATCTLACTVRTAGALLVRAPRAKRPVLRLALPRMRAPLRAGAARPIVIKLSRKATARLRTALSPPRRRAVATVRVQATGASGKAAANRTVTVG